MTMMRGYSLPMVILLMAILAAAGSTAIVALTSSAEATATMINRRQAFYACDGVGRAAMVKARDYMRTDPTPTTPELQLAVCGAATGCPSAASFAPAGYTIDKLELGTAGNTACAVNADCESGLCNGGVCSDVEPLPNGPFRGMNARQTDVSVLVEATKVTTGARCRIDEQIVLGEIGLFQFFVFSDGYMDLFNVGDMSIAGRVHVNGDFCAHVVNSSDSLRIDIVTASKRILSGTNCPRADQGSGPGFEILDAASNTYRSITRDNDHLCTSCTPTPGTGPWRSYAMTRWGGNAQDSAHNVPNLRLPVIGTAAVQDGRDATGGEVDNSETLKMLLDPPQGGDNASILGQRYAAKADIVIINGIWFRKRAGIPWPGEAIWSDHLGRYTPNCGSSSDEGRALCARGYIAAGVGQRDLFSSGVRPTRFSYYQHDGATPGVMRNVDIVNRRPVVSYGPLHGSSGTRTPGRWNGTTLQSVGGDPAAILDGTRSGFQDFRVRRGVAGTEYKLLPMNFDIEAFAAALADTSTRELGSYFPDGGDADTAPDFNGIVYIINTWPTWDQRFDASTAAVDPPDLWPDVTGGSNGTLTGVLGGATSGKESDRLPYNLCGTDATLVGALTVPACGTADQISRPNALRFINGATISPTTFPNGLAIASNQGVYIVGDLNSGSINASNVPTANWRPLMIGGDAITLLSNSWDDNEAEWDRNINTGSNLTNRAATTTTYVFASISGNVETSAAMRGGGINNFPRFLENWNGDTARIYGSLVIGFRSAYQWQPFTGSGTGQGVYEAPDRQWLFDVNFDLPANQPPGTPSFFVQAVQTWRRD